LRAADRLHIDLEADQSLLWDFQPDYADGSPLRADGRSIEQGRRSQPSLTIEPLETIKTIHHPSTKAVETGQVVTRTLRRPRGRRSVSAGGQAGPNPRGSAWAPRRAASPFPTPRHPQCDDGMTTETTASARPRTSYPTGAACPTGDAPPSPWPPKRSRYDLGRLYRLRRRSVSTTFGERLCRPASIASGAGFPVAVARRGG